MFLCNDPVKLHNALLRALIFNEHLYDSPRKTPPSSPVVHVVASGTSPFSATGSQPSPAEDVEQEDHSPTQTSKSEKHKSGHHKKSSYHKVYC